MFVLLSHQSVSEQVEEHKKLGNAQFALGNYDTAIEFYTIALSICPDSEKGLLSVIYQNRAAAYSKLVKYTYKHCWNIVLKLLIKVFLWFLGKT